MTGWRSSSSSCARAADECAGSNLLRVYAFFELKENDGTKSHGELNHAA